MNLVNLIITSDESWCTEQCQNKAAIFTIVVQMFNTQYRKRGREEIEYETVRIVFFFDRWDYVQYELFPRG